MVILQSGMIIGTNNVKSLGYNSYLRNYSKCCAFFLIFLFLAAMPLPLLESVSTNESASAKNTRYLTTFGSGNIEEIATYQTGQIDTSITIDIPRGVEVSGFSMDLSGASSTGWAQSLYDDRSDWESGSASNVDVRSDDLTLSMQNVTRNFIPHSLETSFNPSISTAWHDNGSYSLQQPHTSNATESLFSQEHTRTGTAISSQSQGAVLKHKGWLYMSDWSTTVFENTVQRIWPSNGTLESTITLDAGSCVIPNIPSSSWNRYYGFRDWTVTDDERLFGILSTYLPYSGSGYTDTQYHRVLEIDIKYDNIWTCKEVYDISNYGPYTGISYDRVSQEIWVLHDNQRKLVPYEFQPGGSYVALTQDAYIFTGNSGEVKGVVVNDGHAYMRCKNGNNWLSGDKLQHWLMPSDSNSMTLRSESLALTYPGYSLTYDGERLITMDFGDYRTTSTLYYREFGTGIAYPTIPQPTTSVWIGDPISSVDQILSANLETSWSSVAVGDRVEYWLSSDNGINWESVENNNTIHFQNPGNTLLWKAVLIGSSAISWWVDLEYSSEYNAGGTWTSSVLNTGTQVGRAVVNWTSTSPSGTGVDVSISQDNGVTWQTAFSGTEILFQPVGNQLMLMVAMTSSNQYLTPTIDELSLEFLEGFPEDVKVDIGNDGTWEIDVADIQTPVQVSNNLMVDALNNNIDANGMGNSVITIAVKASSPGRIKLSNLNIVYNFVTHINEVFLESSILVPDGQWRNLATRIDLGDNANTIQKVTIALNNSYGDDPVLNWESGDVCNELQDPDDVIVFDTGNCTSFIDSFDSFYIQFPIKVNWNWNDETKLDVAVTIDDNLGRAVTNWEDDGFNVRIENDIQLDGLGVFDETGRELFGNDWLRGGYDITFAGAISFEGTSISPSVGDFNISIMGENLTVDGDSMEEPYVLDQGLNQGFGTYNTTFQSPSESSPGGMLFSVVPTQLPDGSEFVNAYQNNILLVLDGNSPLVIDINPEDGEEKRAGQQSVTVSIQDSVDPPTQITLYNWVEGEHDFNFNGLPDINEYSALVLATPEIQAGGMNIFQGLIDDSANVHGERVSVFVTGSDGQGNAIAMGGEPVCDEPCQNPDWDRDLTTYYTREDFAPTVDMGNSSILGHADELPLHPNIPYSAILRVSDFNGKHDISEIQLSLVGDLSEEEASIWAEFHNELDGNISMKLESGGDGIAVSNLYSYISEVPGNPNAMDLHIKFQLTWEFSEIWDTDGLQLFVPMIEIADYPCRDGEMTPCYTERGGMGNDKWSFDNDFIFDTNHIVAEELRNGRNLYRDDGGQSVIGAGQAIRFTGKVTFSEDLMPAPSGLFTIELNGDEYTWSDTTDDNGYFSIDFIVPDVSVGMLDLEARIADLPNSATDKTENKPLLRLAVDGDLPVVTDILFQYIVGSKVNTISSNDAMPLTKTGNLNILMTTKDSHGFNLNNPPILNYAILAGTSQLKQGSLELNTGTKYENDYFWESNIDLGDNGTTLIQPGNQLDVWVTGSDLAGNPFTASGNSEMYPYSSYIFTHDGAYVDLRNVTTQIEWSDSTPEPDQNISLIISGVNTGGTSGELTFVIEQCPFLASCLSEQEWVALGSSQIVATEGKTIDVEIEIVSPISDGDAWKMNYRLVEYSNYVELDRIGLETLIVQEEVVRDGAALGQQFKSSPMSLAMYVIALVATSYGVWMMILYRRVIKENMEDEINESIQNEEFEDGYTNSGDGTIEQMAANQVSIQGLQPLLQNIPPPPGLSNSPQVMQAPPPPPGLSNSPQVMQAPPTPPGLSNSPPPQQQALQDVLLKPETSISIRDEDKPQSDLLNDSLSSLIPVEEEVDLEVSSDYTKENGNDIDGEIGPEIENSTDGDDSAEESDDAWGDVGW